MIKSNFIVFFSLSRLHPVTNKDNRTVKHHGMFGVQYNVINLNTISKIYPIITSITTRCEFSQDIGFATNHEAVVI